MKTRIIEATNGEQNWGKFLVGAFDATERQYYSVVDTPSRRPLLPSIGIGERAYLVLDLQTEEGGIFTLGGHAGADLNKHRIWVCPLFEPFLVWLYANWREHSINGEEHWWQLLPSHVDLPDAPFAMYGYRRDGTE